MYDVELSIGICAHNEEETIGPLIEQIVDENVNIGEIIVVVAGDDSTKEIVLEKERIYDEISVVEEEKRRGQIYAQNEIISRAKNEAIILIDGDGLINSGSLDVLMRYFNGKNVLSGKEVPITDDSLMGSIIETYGDIHEDICREKTRFSTNLGVFPADLIESFPEIILDDAYIEHKANKQNLDIKYVPEAVKFHNTPNKLLFFFHQQKKNWIGRFQANKRGLIHNKPKELLLNTYLNQVKKNPRRIPELAALGLIESAAYLTAQFYNINSKFPVKWYRTK